MTQEPPQSWPRRAPTGSGTRPLAVDPLTGEFIDSDLSPGPVDPGPGWLPPVAYPAPGPAPAGWPPAAVGPVAHPAAGPSLGYGLPYGYGPTPHGYWPVPYNGIAAARPTNGMAVASLVLGVVWLFWIGSVLALVFGYVGRQQIRRTGEGGDGLAVAGIVLGWVGVGFLALTILSATTRGA